MERQFEVACHLARAALEISRPYEQRDTEMATFNAEHLLLHQSRGLKRTCLANRPSLITWCPFHVNHVHSTDLPFLVETSSHDSPPSWPAPTAPTPKADIVSSHATGTARPLIETAIDDTPLRRQRRRGRQKQLGICDERPKIRGRQTTQNLLQDLQHSLPSDDSG